MKELQPERPVLGVYRQKFKFKDDVYYLRDFKNLESFYDFASVKGLEDYSSHDSNSAFRGTKDFPEAIKFAREGWPEGLKGLEYYEDIAYRDYAIREAQNIWDVNLNVTGAYVDIGSYLEGVPECMCDFVSKDINKFADVVINPSCSAWVKKETIFDRGREILKLVDVLEKNHIKTRVSCIDIFCMKDINYGDRYIEKVLIKDYNEILDQNRIVFPLCNVGYTRRFAFAGLESEEDIREDFGCPYAGYGYPGNIENLPDELWKSGYANTHTFLFDDINRTRKNVKETKEKIKKLIEEGDE